MHRDEIVEKLTGQHQEAQIGLGLDSSKDWVIELYASKSGTFTILKTRSDGLSCFVVSGEGWVVAPLVTGDGT